MLQLFPLMLPHLVELFHRRHLSIVLPLILLIRKLFHSLILSFIDESLRLIEELFLLLKSLDLSHFVKINISFHFYLVCPTLPRLVENRFIRMQICLVS